MISLISLGFRSNHLTFYKFVAKITPFIQPVSTFTLLVAYSIRPKWDNFA